MTEPDPVVIRAAARGDRDAVEELVRAYQPVVWRFLRNLVRDPALAEDVAQETFLRMYRRLGGFRFQSKFSTWLLQIARNAGIDALRARGRRPTVVAVVPEPAPQADGVTQLEINEAIADLPLRLREAFVLVEVLGVPYRDAARTLEVPEGTVKSRVFHARRQLVAWLDASDPGASRAL